MEDQGVGIPESQVLKLFQPFSHSASDFSVQGLGLGLFIVNTIVTAHKGTITVETQPNFGSTFTVTIPII
ncbi:MAG: sensor histidine kinase [Candidatus Hodarchaeales archaeon]